MNMNMDFDMGILPATLLTPVITAFTAILLRVAKTILGLTAITDAMMAQAQLPSHLAGFFLTNPFIKLQVVHLASLAASWKHTFQWLQLRGPTEAQCLFRYSH